MSTDLRRGMVVGPAEMLSSVGGPLPTQHRLMADQTSGAVFAFTGSIEPGTLVPPHTHEREDEVTYILEGEMTVELGADIFKAAAGAVVWKPRGLRHAQWNATSRSVRYFEVVTPAGLEGFFMEIGRLTATGALQVEAVMEASRKYGLDFDMAHAGELATEFNLRAPA